jgi:hypothetical protein
VTLRDFQEAVGREFGPRLERATPANVREFTARMQAQLFDRREGGRLLLEARDEAESCEQIIKEFFAGVLYDPPERAVIILWLTALELWFEVITQDYGETFDSLFGDLEG